MIQQDPPITARICDSRFDRVSQFPPSTP
jgi:hypothetical protein